MPSYYVAAASFLAFAFAIVRFHRTVCSYFSLRLSSEQFSSEPNIERIESSSSSGLHSGTTASLQPICLAASVFKQASDLFNNSREAYENALKNNGHVISVKRKGKVAESLSFARLVV